MLACTAMLVGCSDDVIEGLDNQEVQKNNTPAYLTVSFNTGSSSSRSTANDANNKGDGHNKTGETGQEHSGHINAGTEAENAIKQVLLVVKHTGEAAGFARLYDAPSNGFPTITQTQDETSYQLAEDIELSTSEYPYEVLVVANPYKALYEEYETVIENGVNDDRTVNALYAAIMTGKTPAVDKAEANNEVGGAWNNFATNIVQTTTDQATENQAASTSLECIMMANKERCTALLKNSGEKVLADVVIERVASKITFRKTNNNNVYDVEVPDLTSVKIKQHTIGSADYNVGTITAKGEDGEQVVTTYYVQLSNNGEVTKLYSGEAGNETEITELTGYTKDSFKWVYEAGEYNTKTWKVKLEQYALVNLSKQVYNVRHTIGENSVAVPFGKLTGSNFLYTPNWETSFNGGINNVKFGEGGEFDGGFTTSPWFYNTLANVSADSKDSENNIYFSNLASSGVNGTDDEPEVDKDDKFHNTDNTNAGTGYLLAYCLENTTDIAHQTHGLSTGITFMGKIYKEDGKTPISTLYRYNGYFFETIDAIKTAYDIKANDEAWTGINEDSGAEALAAVGIVKYDSNTCYYYTTEIKHFDNGKPLELGNMEFAIMRNNIYSLSVSGINIIGDPWVDPIPSTPDEVDKPKLEVHAIIEPWIVRYHDIEFN